MKIFTNKNIVQKIIIALVCIILLNFCMAPTPVYAEDSILDSTLAGYLFSFLTLLGDVAVSVVQLGVTGEWSYAVDDLGSGIYNEDGTMDPAYWKKGSVGWAIYYPVIKVSPELIFGNEIELLDVDFIGGTEDKEYELKAGDKSAISELRTIIASWYVTLRTVAIVGLLSVLIYIGIRIIISSTSQDRAKYKQRLIDWVVAFCLLFFMHYIMAAVITVVDKVNDLLINDDSKYITIPAEYGTVNYKYGLKADTGAVKDKCGSIYNDTTLRNLPDCGGDRDIALALAITEFGIELNASEVWKVAWGWKTIYEKNAGYVFWADNSALYANIIPYTTSSGEDRVLILYERFTDDLGTINTYEYSCVDMTADTFNERRDRGWKSS